LNNFPLLLIAAQAATNESTNHPHKNPQPAADAGGKKKADMDLLP